MLKKIEDLQREEAFDVVVIGAGGAGMSAALVAAIDGARVLLVESTAHVGGTSAWSGGTTWIPGTDHGRKVNPEDSAEAAGRFMDRAVGGRSDPRVRAALVQHGRDAVNFVEASSHVRYRPRDFHPDYLAELEDSTLCGRALEPEPFDGRLLGELLALVRPPIPEFTVLGGMMVDREDISHLLNFTRSWISFKYVARILARHASDRLRYPRGTRLVMGNALIGRLLLSLRERGVTLMTETHVTGLVRGETGIEAVKLTHGGSSATITVRGGVILASGGFNRHPERRRKLAPGVEMDWCVGAPGHTGTAHDLAEAVGACYGKGALSNCFWAPVSIRRRADGSTAVFPHFVFDRAKPGMVTVNVQGRRFLNESTSYHLFGIAMQDANREVPCIPAFLITDAMGLRRYGMGMVRPGGRGLASYLADGYLTQADTLDELAQKLGVDAAGLKETVAHMNEYARTGVDPEFGRGTTAYQRANGDPDWPGPNPNLGPIQTAPFYAVRLYPGDIGAATGFLTDARARVLDGDEQPIPGLYAAGNDMHSIMGGTYPGPGITLGPGLVFAYIAARDAVARAGGTRAPAATTPSAGSAVR